MKIVVLGAGVIGTTSAWYLAQAGHEVTVLERRPAPGDRRVKLLGVTAQGVAAREKAAEVMSQPPKGFGRLSAAEAEQLARLLDKATDNDPLT